MLELLKKRYGEKRIIAKNQNKISIYGINNSSELITYIVNNNVNMKQAYYNSDSAEYLYNSIFEKAGGENENYI